MVEGFLLGELATARSPSLFGLFGTFNISNVHLALFKTTLLVGSVSCCRRTGRALAIFFTSMKWLLWGELWGELAPARSPSVFELFSSFNISNVHLALFKMMPSVDGVSCWFCLTGGALAIDFTSMNWLL